MSGVLQTENRKYESRGVPAPEIGPETARLLKTLAIVSLLGDDAKSNAATRPFAGSSVLAATMDRVARASNVGTTTVLAWDDQLPAIGLTSADIRSQGPRNTSAALAETSAALRWSDGWRGGLLGKTTFDRGFDADAILAALDAANCDAAMLIDAAAALIDPATLDLLVSHLSALPDQTFAFAPGAVGSGAMVLRREAIADLAAKKRGPGWLTMYHPDRPIHDPIAKSYVVPVAPRVARSGSRMTVDSSRQVARLSLVQARDVESVVAALDASQPLDAMPRDVTLELTTRRATKPIWSLQSQREIERPDLSLEAARALFGQLGKVDDVRLTLGGVGDPLLHPQLLDIIGAARSAGIRAIHLETDLLPVDLSVLDAIATSDIDIVSFHLPAAHATTYAKLMGVDRMREVLENVKQFLLARAARSSGVPILVPTFVKCETNLGEMEAWYDQWIRAVGTAVIAPPSDFGGRLDYVGVADMTAGRRRACRRLASRLTILSDGRVASCEEDVLGEQTCGTHVRVGEAWNDGLSMLRSLHAEHRWDESELCRACRMWDRP